MQPELGRRPARHPAAQLGAGDGAVAPGPPPRARRAARRSGRPTPAGRRRRSARLRRPSSTDVARAPPASAGPSGAAPARIVGSRWASAQASIHSRQPAPCRWGRRAAAPGAAGRRGRVLRAAPGRGGRGRGRRRTRTPRRQGRPWSEVVEDQRRADPQRGRDVGHPGRSPARSRSSSSMVAVRISSRRTSTVRRAWRTTLSGDTR